MEKSTYQKARKIDIFKYAFGGAGSNIAFMLMMSYLTFFYTDIFGISQYVVAGLMLVARIIDAVTDPLMGMIGDRTRSRFGKYRPWIMFGAPVLGLMIFLVFYTPALSPTTKIVYAYITYIVYSLASTVVNIPYHSLTPVISKDPNQRTAVVSAKQGMALIPGVFVSILALPLVNAFGGGQTGWAIYAALMAVMTTVAFWLCAWGAKRYDKGNKAETSTEKITFGQQLRLVVRNKPLVMMLIAFGSDVFAGAAVSAVNVYYFLYVLGRQDLVAVSSLIGLVASGVGLLLVSPLSRRFGKKKLSILGSALSIVPLAALWAFPTGSVVFIMAMLAVYGLLSRIPGTLGWAMLPDCADYAEWKFGLRGDGVISSSLTFINKVGMALGGALASLLLGLVGYAAGVAQTPQVLTTINFLRFGMPIIGYLISLASLPFYELNTKRYNEIRTELDARKGGES